MKKEQGARNRAQGRKTKFQKTISNKGRHKRKPKKQGEISKGLEQGIGANSELKNYGTYNPHLLTEPKPPKTA